MTKCHLWRAIKISFDHVNNFWICQEIVVQAPVYIIPWQKTPTWRESVSVCFRLLTLALSLEQQAWCLTEVVYYSSITWRWCYCAISSTGNFRWQMNLASFFYGEPLGLAIGIEHQLLFVAVRHVGLSNMVMVFEWVSKIKEN